jgi:hypothetical protein
MPAQRWRLIVARSADAPALGQREQLAAWQAVVDAAGLDDPGAPDRPKLVFAAPLAVGASADRELIDLLLPRRLTSAEVRLRIESRLPAGHRLVDLHDVWLGEPPLAAQVVAADYRVTVTTGAQTTVETRTGERPPRAGEGVAALGGGSHAPARAGDLHRAVDLGRAVRAFLAGELPSGSLVPTRRAPTEVRALVEDLRVLGDCELWLRVTVHATRGSGRPDDVVAILGALAGVPLRVARLHRECLWLAVDDPREGPGAHPPPPRG